MLNSHTHATGGHFFLGQEQAPSSSVVPDQPNTSLYLSSLFTGKADVICHAAAAAAGCLTVLTPRRAFCRGVRPAHLGRTEQAERVRCQSGSSSHR